MQQAIINPDLSVTFETSTAIPKPGEWDVIIQAETASINPVNWKAAPHKKVSDHQPAGKDFAGTVHSVGSKVFQFKPGDRVGALNHISGFAEYSIGPSWSTYKLPDHVSFEEAAAFGLAYFTAALGLFSDMPAPAPWSPARPKDYNPLLVYGASSAVGAYAVKLAALANIHPIIAVAGAGADGVITKVLKTHLGDTLIDYRKHDTPESLVAAIRKAAYRSGTVKYAYDVITTESTINNIIASVLDPEGSSYLAYAVPSSFPFKVPPKTPVTQTRAPNLFVRSDPDGENGKNGATNAGSRAFASAATRYLEFALGEGLIEAHPLKILPEGLNSLEGGLKDLKEGRNKSLKYVMRVPETKW